MVNIDSLWDRRDSEDEVEYLSEKENASDNSGDNGSSVT